MDSGDDLNPSPELIDFMEAGSPPVYVGFGSMGNRNPEYTTALVLKAFDLSGQRAILHTGWGGLSKLDVPDSILIVNSAPHAWLFPRVKAVIHHGGAGTTAVGLRSGVPSIIVPFHGDQPFWGQLVAKIRVGPEPIPYKKLTTERLVEAIIKSESHEIQQNAYELGNKIEIEDGVSDAVSIINQIDL